MLSHTAEEKDFAETPKEEEKKSSTCSSGQALFGVGKTKVKSTKETRVIHLIFA